MDEPLLNKDVEPGKADQVVTDALDYRPSLLQKLVFTLPTLFTAFNSVVLQSWLTTSYGAVTGSAFVSLAIAVSASALALLNPVMGWFSDAFRSRFGRRKPFILVATPLMAGSIVALFYPPASLSPLALAAWYCAAQFLLNLTSDLYSIPYQGMSLNLSSDSNDRTVLFAFLFFFGSIGGWAGTSLPALVGVPVLMGVVSGGGLVLSTALLLWLVPERPAHLKQEKEQFVPALIRCLRNREYRVLLLIGIGSTLSPNLEELLPIFVTHIIKSTPATEFQFFLVSGPAAWLFTLLWLFLGRWLGKRKAWALNTVVAVFSGVALFFVDQVWSAMAIVYLIISSLDSSGGSFLADAVFADIVDYDELLTGRRREATYQGMLDVIESFSDIPGLAAPFAILAALHYDASDSEQSPQLDSTLRYIFCFAALPSCLVTLLGIWLLRINEAKHKEIVQALALRRAGVDTVDPLTGRALPPPLFGMDLDLFDHFGHWELRLSLRRPSAFRAYLLAQPALLSAGLATCVYFGWAGGLLGSWLSLWIGAGTICIGLLALSLIRLVRSFSLQAEAVERFLRTLTSEPPAPTN